MIDWYVNKNPNGDFSIEYEEIDLTEKEKEFLNDTYIKKVTGKKSEKQNNEEAYDRAMRGI